MAARTCWVLGRTSGRFQKRGEMGRRPCVCMCVCVCVCDVVHWQVTIAGLYEQRLIINIDNSCQLKNSQQMPTFSQQMLANARPLTTDVYRFFKH